MVDINGAGAADVGGLSTTGTGQARRWDVEIIDPPNDASLPITTFVVTTRLTTWNEQAADVRLQVSSSPNFSTTLHDSTVNQGHGVDTGRTVTGFTDGNYYYIRARSGDGVSSGDWSPTTKINVSLKSGDTIEHMYVNTGLLLFPSKDDVEQMYTNVGTEKTPDDSWPAYNYQNVGFEQIPADNWPAYQYQEVTTDPPFPVIWFIRPTYGRAGDGISIIGFGFGDLQSTFSGMVEMDYGDPTGWVLVPVLNWQTYPADPGAYGPDRTLDQDLGIIDMQHTIIEITIPADAVPPGYPLRVRTVT